MSVCEISPICGNAYLQLENGEECDDGNTVDGDGCDSACVVEEFFLCTNVEMELSICDRDYQCGNGIQEVENVEECDDGNMDAGDGCSEVCRIEPGWTCTLNLGRSSC